jgi:hypothetical protein
MIPPVRKSEWDVYIIQTEGKNYIHDKQLHINESKTNKRIIPLPDELWAIITEFIITNNRKKKLIPRYEVVVPLVCRSFFLDIGLKGISTTVGAFRQIYISSNGSEMDIANAMGHSYKTALLDYTKKTTIS